MFRLVETQNDIERISLLAQKIWRQHYSSINSNDCIEYMLNKFQSPHAITHQLSCENYEYYLIEHNEVFCGFLGVQKRKSELFLSKFYIDRDFRGISLGRAAFDFVKEIARKYSLDKITLTVNKRNFTTIDIYKHFGFKIVDSVVVDIGQNYVMDDYIMELNL